MLALVAVTAVLWVCVPLAIERVSKAAGWKDTHWSAAGTIAAAFVAAAGVIFSLVQNRQQRTDAVRQLAAAEQEHHRQERNRLQQEEYDAVQAILGAASVFSARVTASAEALMSHLKHLEYMEHAQGSWRPGDDAVQSVRRSLSDSQDIIRYRMEAMLVASNAATTTFVALQKIRTPSVVRAARDLHSAINTTGEHITGATGEADWEQAEKGAGVVAERARALMIVFQDSSTG